MEARRASTAARETPLYVRKSSLRIEEDTEPDGGRKSIEGSQRDTTGSSEVESENTEPDIVDGGRKCIDGNQRDFAGRSRVEPEIVNSCLRSIDGNQRDTAR